MQLNDKKKTLYVSSYHTSMLTIYLIHRANKITSLILPGTLNSLMTLLTHKILTLN